MAAKKVLIVDDETDICELIEITLMRMDIASQSALNLNDAKILLASEHFDLCLTDMRLPDGNGIELVEHVQANFNDLPMLHQFNAVAIRQAHIGQAQIKVLGIKQQFCIVKIKCRL